MSDVFCRYRTCLAFLVVFIVSSLLPAPSDAFAQNDRLDLREALAWQIALDRVGFSPGVIDGAIGRKTRLATAEFQRVRGLPVSGELDAPTRRQLEVDPASAMTTYRISQEDVRSVGPPPKTWLEKSLAKRLGYESVLDAVAERHHCTKGLLHRLNPRVNLTRLEVGDELSVPNVHNQIDPPRGRSCTVEIDVAEKTIRVLDEKERLVAIFHCSIAKHYDKVPRKETSIGVVTENPTYLFDPKMWPEVKDVKEKLLIPKGPRNPVGLCWIGLNLPGYGIHGSPAPELIGKTGSHGCFRLTNWDALRLARMVEVGTRVRFTGHERLAVSRSWRGKEQQRSRAG